MSWMRGMYVGRGDGEGDVRGVDGDGEGREVGGGWDGERG